MQDGEVTEHEKKGGREGRTWTMAVTLGRAQTRPWRRRKQHTVSIAVSF
jgi:hypothetical protein